jgi:hypothetical protein
MWDSFARPAKSPGGPSHAGPVLVPACHPRRICKSQCRPRWLPSCSPRSSSWPVQEWLPAKRMQDYYTQQELDLALARGTIEARTSKAPWPNRPVRTEEDCVSREGAAAAIVGTSSRRPQEAGNQWRLEMGSHCKSPRRRTLKLRDGTAGTGLPQITWAVTVASASLRTCRGEARSWDRRTRSSSW